MQEVLSHVKITGEPLGSKGTPIKSKIYGDITLDADEEGLLTLQPGYATYPIISLNNIIIEAELTLTKIRWE